MKYQIRSEGVIDRFQCPAPECEEIIDVPEIGSDERQYGSGRIVRRKLNLTCVCGREIKLFLQCEDE